MVYIIKFREEAPEGRFRTDRQNSFFFDQSYKVGHEQLCRATKRTSKKEAKLISYACHLNDYLALFPVSR
jgi:hypothetical protein